MTVANPNASLVMARLSVQSYLCIAYASLQKCLGSRQLQREPKLETPVEVVASEEPAGEQMEWEVLEYLAMMLNC